MLTDLQRGAHHPGFSADMVATCVCVARSCSAGGWCRAHTITRLSRPEGALTYGNACHPALVHSMRPRLYPACMPSLVLSCAGTVPCCPGSSNYCSPNICMTLFISGSLLGSKGAPVVGNSRTMGTGALHDVGYMHAV